MTIPLSEADKIQIAHDTYKAGATREVAAHRSGLTLDDLDFLVDTYGWVQDQPRPPVTREDLATTSRLGHQGATTLIARGIRFIPRDQPEPTVKDSVEAIRDISALRKYIKEAHRSDPDHGAFDAQEVDALVNYTTAMGCKLAIDLATAASGMLRDPGIAPEHVVLLSKVVDIIKDFRQGVAQGGSDPQNQHNPKQNQGTVTPGEMVRQSGRPFAIAPVLLDPMTSGSATAEEEIDE